MKIGYVCSSEEHLTDTVLADVSRSAAREGLALAGTIQIVDPARIAEKCDITLGLLPDGEQRSISVDLGPGVAGCRLDPAALEDAVMVVHQRLSSAHALVVNKFGKQEAAGRGLVSAIGEACERGLPVLVGVSPEWRDAFLEFTEGQAKPLPTDAGEIHQWLKSCCAERA